MYSWCKEDGEMRRNFKNTVNPVSNFGKDLPAYSNRFQNTSTNTYF